MEIRMVKFWDAIIESCVVDKEFPFSDLKKLRDAIFEHILFLDNNFHTCISFVVFDREH